MTCRYCKKQDGLPMVKYEVRHYAHFACFLDLKGTHGLMSLSAWKIKQFPWLLVKERGIESQIKAAIAHGEGKEGT